MGKIVYVPLGLRGGTLLFSPFFSGFIIIIIYSFVCFCDLIFFLFILLFFSLGVRHVFMYFSTAFHKIKLLFHILSQHLPSHILSLYLLLHIIPQNLFILPHTFTKSTCSSTTFHKIKLPPQNLFTLPHHPTKSTCSSSAFRKIYLLFHIIPQNLFNLPQHSTKFRALPQTLYKWNGSV